MHPETKYVTVGDGDVAYQVVGEGPTNLVLLGTIASNVDMQWLVELQARKLRRLASFSRLICFDRRGTGLSDRAPLEEVTAYEHWNDDLLAVLDATETDRVSLLCEIDGCMWGLLFAATFPERVDRLVLWNGYARLLADDDCPGITLEASRSQEELVGRLWGTVELERLANPQNDQGDWHAAAMLQRSAITPAAFRRRMELTRHADVRQILPAVQAPTLAVHRKDNIFIPADLTRYLADHITGAQFVQVDGAGIVLDDEPALSSRSS